MERPTSENDKPGYIYVYQLKESTYCPSGFFWALSTLFRHVISMA